MGTIANWFKSPQERERERKAYDKWTYPYNQKEVIDKLILDTFPTEDSTVAIFNYLIVREEMHPIDSEEKFLIDESKYAKQAKLAEKRIFFKSKPDMSIYMALAEADLLIDENLNYPSVEQIKQRATKIKEIIAE